MQIKSIFLLSMMCFFVQFANADSVTLGGHEFDFDKAEHQLTDDKQKSFYQAFRKASAAGLAEAFKDIIHPGSYTCQTSDLDKQAFDHFIRRDINRSIPENAKVKWFPWKKEVIESLSMDGMAAFPAEPEAILGISYSEKIKDNKGQVIKDVGDMIMRAVARTSDGQFKIAIPCLTEKGRKLFAQKKK